MRKSLLKLTYLFFALFLPKIAAAYDIEINGIYYNADVIRQTVSVTFGDVKYSGNVVIPEIINYKESDFTVNAIDNNAFYNCSGLRSVTLPGTINAIRDKSFGYCTNLTSLIIPNSVTSIGLSAFEHCTNLQSLTIPNSVTLIGNKAFDSCSKLQTVNLPNSLSYLGDSAFEFCSDLRSITIPSSLRDLYQRTFHGCTGLESVFISSSIQTIGDWAFDGCTSLKSIEIPNNVNTIGFRAFVNCTNLERVYVEEGYGTIFADDDIFFDCPIKELFYGKHFSFLKPILTLNKLEIGRNIESVNFLSEECIALKELDSYTSFPPVIPVLSEYLYATVDVYVPTGSVSTYKSNGNWRNFRNINELKSNNQVEAIYLNKSHLELIQGNSYQLSASIIPKGLAGVNIEWLSSNPNVAIVSDNGMVSAIKPGSSMIYARVDNVSASCEVTVVDDSGIEELYDNSETLISIFSTSGILIKADMDVSEIQNLPKGVYIVRKGTCTYKVGI